MKETTIIEMRTSTSDPVSLEQLREEAYKIRKFEIQNLWQRSIFLAAFIVILITGYGHLVEKLLSEYEKWQISNQDLLLVAEAICCALAFLGSIFSIIWIMMAKGSKAWYEIHEKRIRKLELELNMEDKHRMRPASPWSLDNSLFSREPGAYSVSRINILLGQILLVAWWLAFGIHSVSTMYLIFNPQDERTYSSPIRILITIVITLLLCGLLCLPFRLRIWAKSGAIKSPEEEEKTNKEKEDKRQ
jgi:hypothetical protein